MTDLVHILGNIVRPPAGARLRFNCGRSGKRFVRLDSLLSSFRVGRLAPGDRPPPEWCADCWVQTVTRHRREIGQATTAIISEAVLNPRPEQQVVK